MRNLRAQLLLSHFMLIGLMLVVIVGGVVSVWHLGRSVDRILANNIKSVLAAQKMKDALAGEDNAALLLLAGRRDDALAQYGRSNPEFNAAFHVQDHNITERGERKLTTEIGALHARYSDQISRFLSGSAGLSPSAQRYYADVLRPSAEDLARRVQAIRDLNEKAILQANDRAKLEARNASWTGIGVAAASFVLALLFAIRVVSTALAPLRDLARQAEQIGQGHLNQAIDLPRSDEIGMVADSFNRMTASLRDAQKLEADRLRRAETMSDAALANLYDPVIVTDASGRVVHLNRAAEGLFGPECAAVGLPIGSCVPVTRVSEAVRRAIRQQRVSAAEDEAGLVTLKAGEDQRVYRLRTTPMRDEDEAVLGAVVVLEDVTHQRALDRLKSEFIGVASHELRTPITSLLLSAQLLEEGAAGPLTLEQIEVVRTQREDLKRLDRLTRDLLDLTRLEAGATPPRLELVDLADLVEAAVSAVGMQAEAKGIRLGVDLPEPLPRARADSGQMTRVFVNLLSNAVRHTPAGGVVTITCGLADGQPFVEVADTGTGIPSEYQDRVFERFVQVPGETQGGAGLGLPIARSIVRAHGGDISVRSAEGRGSTFTVTLPSSIELPASGSLEEAAAT
jgi:NtrC-family two-component system sensor histidine kinase KinB